jgi:CHAT domain-containing protein
MKQAFAAKTKGDLQEAHRLFCEGRDWCVRHGHPVAALRFSTTATSIRYLAGDYRTAASEYLEEEREASRLADQEEIAAIRTNLASLYLQSNEPESAARVAESALAEIGTTRAYAKPYLLVILASAYSQRGAVQRAEQMFADALSEALDMDLPDAALMGWDRLGTQRLNAGDVDGAGRCFAEAYRYRRLHRPADLGASYLKLGLLHFKIGRLDDALRFTNMALRREPIPIAPEQYVYHHRGKILLAMNQPESALADFDRALTRAATWRDDGLPAEILRAQSNAAVQEMYDSYIQTAMLCYRRSGRLEYARAAWEALEGNRAASLRRSLADSGLWRDRLPAEYWLTLASFRQAIMAGSSPRPARLAGLQDALLKMETQASLDPSPSFGENTTARLPLPLFQGQLTTNRILISFALGDRSSYRWVVTGSGIHASALPPRSELTGLAAQFEDAVRNDRPASVALGQRLYSTLFSSLPAEAETAPLWLLSLDDALFDLPFSALVCSRLHGAPVFLAERHATEIVPGAWAVGRSYPPAGRFVGIGDAVYNSADPRVSERQPRAGLFRLSAKDAGMELPRLPGTRQEIESCSREYSSQPGLLFSGWDSSRQGLARALSENPSIIHLAAHVVPDKNGSQGLIILSGAAPGQVDALTVRDIATLRVPGSLVVMSGCESGRGRALRGAGRLGLGRAWLLAGARGVIASHWPVADDSGILFQSFYRHLRNAQLEGESPAGALCQARADLIRSGGSTALPKYWAAYEFIGRSN